MGQEELSGIEAKMCMYIWTNRKHLFEVQQEISGEKEGLAVGQKEISGVCKEISEAQD
jgi:hypothetical protein